MAADDETTGTGAPGAPRFGSCCAELKDAMTSDEFEPMITVGEDGVLMMGVGLVDLEDDEQGIVDHPLFFCPFCGTKLQTKDEVRKKTGETVG